MIKIRTNYKVKLALLGLCGALSGRLYGTQANDASAGQKEKAAHYQGPKKPKKADKARAAFQSEQNAFCQLFKISKKQMKTKAYQDIFLYFKQQEVLDEQKYALAREVYITKFYHLPEEKREKAVYNKMFFLTVALKKQRINEIQSKIEKLAKSQ